jgi:methylmalonyl-CoA/ethylmalonyl-CoA epimerase
VEPAADFLTGELGGSASGAGPGAGFRFWQWEFAGGGRIELLVPDGPAGGFLHRFLEARGPGAHHVTFKVPDIHAAMERAGRQGYEVVGFDDTWPSWQEAFLHPRQAQGIVVQLVESHPELEQEPPGSWPFPPAPAAPPPAVRLVGLRLRAGNEERARRQWESLLRGACRRQGNTLSFHWPESPLRIAVDLEPGSPEGPIALELATRRGVGLPEGPHPLFGIPFVLVED